MVADGWIFAEAPRDMSADLAPMTAAAALTDLANKGISAVPVQTLKELVERQRTGPTRTVRFEKRERDGWVNECFAPTWFCPRRRREPASCRAAADRLRWAGDSDRARICGEEIERLEDAGIVGPIEWYRRMYQST